MPAHDPPSVLLRRYLEAIPDFGKVAALLTEDVRFTLFARKGKTNVGRHRIVGGLAREFETFYRPDAFSLEVMMTFGDDQFAGARFEITADTSRGHYHNNYAIMARFEDGLLAEAWEYLDSASAAAQLAGGPAPTTAS